MKLVVLVFAVCLVGVYCGVWVEETTVLPTQKTQGFACKSSNARLGLMRAGEQRVNFRPKFCGSARCRSNGEVTFATCEAVEVGPECLVVRQSSGPYPACCPIVAC